MSEVSYRSGAAATATLSPAPGDADGATGPNTGFSARLRALRALNTRLICMNADLASYQEIVQGIERVIGCDACALFLHDPQAGALVLKATVGYDLDVRDHEIPLDDSSRMHCQAFQEEYLIHVPDRAEAPGAAPLDDEMLSCLVLPIIANQGPVGVLDFGSRRPHAFTSEDVDLCSMLVDQMAYSLENVRLLGELRESRDAVIRGMALLAESRDHNIGGHLDRICASSRMLAGQLLGLPRFQGEVTVDYVETIARAAALHDIGKVAIPDLILLKPGPLSQAEFAVMRSHTTLGHELLSHLMAQHGAYAMIQMGAEVSLSHHEWWDGSGYPQGRRGDEIPLAARIVALADVYDALTSRRVYKDPWEHRAALAAIRAKAGTQFDPELTEILLARPDELLAIRSAYPE
ncbi:MAG: HD domain-containing phosphohydrolase [Candidatus Krumholzibacteriia bacterium]